MKSRVGLKYFVNDCMFATDEFDGQFTGIELKTTSCTDTKCKP